MADLILNDSEMAERAVENCRHKSSRNLPRFESESEFRGWIFRVLIDEALSTSPGRY
jgi:DNA-directed RNA polymerase specialized sigma24 family protein